MPAAPIPEPATDFALADDFKPMGRAEAEAWRRSVPRVSVWSVLAWQLVLAVLVVLLTSPLAFVFGSGWVLSVGYGALCVLVPSALMAYGLTHNRVVRTQNKALPSSGTAVLAGVFFWEGVKLLLAVVMLAMTPLLLDQPNWLGLLLGLMVVLKSYLFAMWSPRLRNHTR